MEWAKWALLIMAHLHVAQDRSILDDALLNEHCQRHDLLALDGPPFLCRLLIRDSAVCNQLAESPCMRIERV